jgi:hypothetical protein
MKRAAQIVIVALPVLMAVLIARFAVDLPWWDEWEWAGLIYKMRTGTLQFADVWAQHNEHRLLTASLIALGLDKLWGWHQITEQFVSLGMLVLSQALIVILMLRTGSGTTRGTIAAALGSVFVYGLWQQENLAWGFQMAWFLCNLCAITVVFLLARPDRQPLHVVCALVAAAVGSVSSSQGLLAWAAGAVAIALGGSRRKQTLALWLPAAAVTYGIFRYGMQSTHSGHLSVLAEPLPALGYALTYLGAPLVRWLGNPSCVIAGTLLIVLIAAAVVNDLREPDRERLARGASWYALATYAVLCALVTAAGRAGLGVDQALNSRYTTIASLAWIALIGLAAVRGFPRHTLTGRARVAAIGVAIVAAYALVANNTHGFVEWKKHSTTLAIDRSELVRGDDAVLDTIYPYHARIVMFARELRTIQDGPFTNP